MQSLNNFARFKFACMKLSFQAEMYKLQPSTFSQGFFWKEAEISLKNQADDQLKMASLTDFQESRQN